MTPRILIAAALLAGTAAAQESTAPMGTHPLARMAPKGTLAAGETVRIGLLLQAGFAYAIDYSTATVWNTDCGRA